MKKFFMYIAVFFFVGTILTTSSLAILDNFIYKLSQTSIIGNSPVSASKEEIKSITKIVLPNDVENIEYSHNNKYYVYLKDSKIYINNISDGKNVTTIEDGNICYIKLLYDKNMILYFTESKTTNVSKIVLKTYQIDNKQKNKYNEISVNNFVAIKDMNMSPIINIIYFNVQTKNGTTEKNSIYRVDLFNNISLIKSGSVYNKMIMLQHKDMVYYEDENYNVYYGSSSLNIFKEKVEMIGIDEDDNLYFLSKNKKDTVYKVKNNKITEKIDLSDTDLVKTYYNNYGVYLIYPNYIINVASSEPYKRIGRLSKYVSFEALKGNKIYLRTTDNLLISTKVID